MHRILVTLLLLGALFHHGCSSSDPYIYWYNQPVIPGETVMLYGNGLQNATITLCIDGTSTCEKSVTPLQVWDISSKFALPSTWDLGVYRVDACTSDGGSCSTGYINQAEVTWIQGHAYNEAIPGYILHIFGRALAFDNEGCISTTSPSGASGTSVILTSIATNENYTLSGIQATCYDLEFIFPATIPPGTYQVSVSNRLQSSPTTVNRTGNPLLLEVIPNPSWPSQVFDIRAQYNGNVSAAVVAAVGLGGGVVYLSTGSCIYMGNGEQLNFSNAQITLLGDGSSESCITWANNTVSPKAPLIIGFSYRILNISLNVESLMSGQFISNYPYGNNFIIDGVNIAVDTGLSNYVGNTLYFINASQVLVTNTFITHTGNCTADWPYYLGIYINGGYNYRLINNKFESSCSDFAVFSVENVIFESNSFVSTGQLIAEGNGFNSLGVTRALSHVAYIRNCQDGSSYSKGENEAWTEDGPGGAYFGPATVDGSSIILATPASSTLWEGGVVFVLNGTGAGQFSRIVSMNTTVVNIVAPFPIPLDETSMISVTAYHGDVIVAGNSFNNGTTVQTYGSATNQIFADNTLSFMKFRPTNRYNVLWSGLNIIGKEYGGGLQPNFFVEVYNNYLISSQYLRIWAIMGGPFGGPWVRSAIVRGNQLYNTTLALENYVSDILVEENTFSDCEPSISIIGDQTENVLIQNNVNGTTPSFSVVICPDTRYLPFPPTPTPTPPSTFHAAHIPIN